MPLFFLLTGWFLTCGQSQERNSIDLLAGFDAGKQTVSGTWRKINSALSVAPSSAARCVLTTDVPDQYDLRIEFSRTQGDDSVVVILPVGSGVSPALEFSAWQGECHGLSRVKGRSSRDADNPTAVRPGRLDNGETYVVDVEVRKKSDLYSLVARLNDKPLLEWSGPPSDLLANIVMTLPQPGSLGLAAQNSAVTFSKVTMTPAPSDRMPGGTSAPTAVRPEDPLAFLEPFNGARFETAKEGTRDAIRALPTVGAGDRGAFLRDQTFSEGVIEVDLKGATQPGGSFVGVVFNGVDGDTYEAVYFRPFNFGHRDAVRRGHAVQYISHPEWPWDKLRKERPEEFENRVEPEPAGDEWFHARVEVGSTRIRVFVDKATEPCLDVERLATVKNGKVGLWFNGIASFSNFQVKAAP